MNIENSADLAAPGSADAGVRAVRPRDLVAARGVFVVAAAGWDARADDDVGLAEPGIRLRIKCGRRLSSVGRWNVHIESVDRRKSLEAEGNYLIDRVSIRDVHFKRQVPSLLERPLTIIRDKPTTVCPDVPQLNAARVIT